MERLRHVYHLGIKELVSLLRDPILIFLIAYSFTFSVGTPSESAVMEVKNASIAVVNEDDSEVARTIQQSFLPPLFLPAGELAFRDVNRAMDAGEFTFVVLVPPNFKADLEADTRPTIEVIADATAMSQAGRGPSYISQIINGVIEP